MSMSTSISTPPDPAVVPLKVNVFDALQDATTSLAAMFPYLHGGAIVPAVTLQRGDPALADEKVGDASFFHRNSEEEVVVCWASSDPKFPPVTLVVLGKQHQVRLMIRDRTDAAEFNLSTITQRQAPAGHPQQESVIFRCPHCNSKILQKDYDGSYERLTAAGDAYGAIDGLRPMFPTVLYGAEVAAEYNATLAGRPCPSCAETIPRFPVEAWGWEAARSKRQAVANGLAAYSVAVSERGVSS